MELDDFGRSVLRALVEPVASPSGALQRAVQCYLADRGSGRAAWRYPDFLRHRPTQGDATDLTLEIEDATWSALRTEAEQQRVSIERLLEHAALYFIARLDSLR